MTLGSIVPITGRLFLSSPCHVTVPPHRAIRAFSSLCSGLWSICDQREGEWGGCVSEQMSEWVRACVRE